MENAGKCSYSSFTVISHWTHDVLLDSVAAPIFPPSLDHPSMNSQGRKQGGRL